MNYLLDEIQRGASGGDAPVAWRGGGLPARWFVDPVVLPHCRRENTLRRFAPSPASGRERGCRHCVVSFTRPHIGGRNVLAGGMRIRGGQRKARPPIPRVLSRVATRMAIHLDLTLPPGSSGLPEDTGEQPLPSSAWPCSR